MSASPDQVQLQTDAIEWREIDGEIVAIDVRTSTYIAANQTATALWAALVAGTNEDALADLLVERFGIDRAQATAEIEAFVATLRDQRLLK